jgi:hypothetical protein
MEQTARFGELQNQFVHCTLSAAHNKPHTHFSTPHPSLQQQQSTERYAPIGLQRCVVCSTCTSTCTCTCTCTCGLFTVVSTQPSHLHLQLSDHHLHLLFVLRRCELRVRELSCVRLGLCGAVRCVRCEEGARRRVTHCCADCGVDQSTQRFDFTCAAHNPKKYGWISEECCVGVLCGVVCGVCTGAAARR